MCRELDFPWCSLLASSTQSTARLRGPWAAGDRSRRVTLLTDVFPPLRLSGLQMSQSSVISKPVGRPHTKQNVCPGETGRHVLPTSSLQSRGSAPAARRVVGSTAYPVSHGKNHGVRCSQRLCHPWLWGHRRASLIQLCLQLGGPGSVTHATSVPARRPSLL